jgi:hypothetical protein
MDSAAYAGGMLIGFALMLLFGAVAFVLIGGLFLKLAVRIIEKFPLGYGRACLVALASGLASMIVSFIVGAVFGSVFGAAGAGEGNYGAVATSMLLAMGIGAVLGFLINAGAIHLLVKRPDGSALGFGRACLVGLLQMAFAMLLYGLLIVVMLGISGLFMPAVFGMPH